MTAKEELNDQRISILIHAAIAAVVGIISLYIGSVLYATVAAVAVAVLAGQATQKVVGQRKFSWWIANGLFVYVFVWIDTWIFMANYF